MKSRERERLRILSEQASRIIRGKTNLSDEAIDTSLATGTLQDLLETNGIVLYSDEDVTELVKLSLGEAVVGGEEIVTGGDKPEKEWTLDEAIDVYKFQISDNIGATEAKIKIGVTKAEKERMKSEEDTALAGYEEALNVASDDYHELRREKLSRKMLTRLPVVLREWIDDVRAGKIYRDDLFHRKIKTKGWRDGESGIDDSEILEHPWSEKVVTRSNGHEHVIDARELFTNGNPFVSDFGSLSNDNGVGINWPQLQPKIRQIVDEVLLETGFTRDDLITKVWETISAVHHKVTRERIGAVMFPEKTKDSWNEEGEE